jgi:hypothetical protein
MAKDDFTTLYLTMEGIDKAEGKYWDLQKVAGRDVGLGDGDWINVYTRDPAVLDKVVGYLGSQNVLEISPDPRRRGKIRVTDPRFPGVVGVFRAPRTKRTKGTRSR